VTLGSVDSTQDEARSRLGDRPRALLVTAARQTQGRGRSGRAWIGAPRALAASLAFRPVWPPAAWPRLTLVAGLAAAEVVEEKIGLDLGLEWPNDLIAPGTGAKVGGILIESSAGVVVAGLGLNLHWPDSPVGMGSLLADDPGSELAGDVASCWADRLLAGAAGDPDAWALADYRRRSTTIGADVTWEPAGSGRAVDVEIDGRLVVETPAGPTRLAAGEISHLRGSSGLDTTS
jgi:BirA family biotin operon repressor/biotin-[acetyl-CoA-carboxylase] ligase